MRSRRKKTIRTIDGFGTLDGVYQGLPTSSYEIDSPTTEPNSDTDDKKSKGHVGYHPSMVLDETLRLTCQEVEVFLNGGQEVVAKNDDGLTIPHK